VDVSAGIVGRMNSFGQLVTTEAPLRAVVVPPADGSPPLAKEIDHLDDHCRDFIARSPLTMLATADARGRCDVSPRGGPAGFVGTLDQHRLLVPDFPGNRRSESWAQELPSASKILRDHMGIPDVSEADVAERLAEGYAKTLY
jgi:hypothetical protein